MNENEAKALIERFAKKAAGQAFCLPALRGNDNGYRERHTERSQPPDGTLCV